MCRITTLAYINGHWRIHKRYYYPSIIKDLGSFQRGLYTAHMLLTFEDIPGIRGRFIPHIECQELKVNVTHFILISTYQIFRTKSFGTTFICITLQIASHSIYCSLWCHTNFIHNVVPERVEVPYKTTQLPCMRGRSMVTTGFSLLQASADIEKQYSQKQ